MEKNIHENKIAQRLVVGRGYAPRIIAPSLQFPGKKQITNNKNQPHAQDQNLAEYFNFRVRCCAI